MASISRWINSWKFASTLKISIFLATTRHHSKKFLQNSNLIEASGPEGIIERKNLLNFDTSKKMNQHGNMWGIHFSTTAVRKEVRKKEFLNLYAVYGQKKKYLPKTRSFFTSSIVEKRQKIRWLLKNTWTNSITKFQSKLQKNVIRITKSPFFQKNAHRHQKQAFGLPIQRLIIARCCFDILCLFRYLWHEMQLNLINLITPINYSSTYKSCWLIVPY